MRTKFLLFTLLSILCFRTTSAQNFTADINVTSDSGAEVNLLNTSSSTKWQVVSGFGSGFEIGNVTAGLTDASAPFYINSIGNVGIGTVYPSRLFHVNGSTTDVVSAFQSTDSGTQIVLTDNSGSLRLGTLSNGGFALSVGGDASSTTGANVMEAMRVTSVGDVGVGIASPSEKFHIYGSGPTRSLVESSDHHAYFVVEGASGRGSFVDYYRNGDGRIWHTGLRDASNNFEFRLNDQSTVLTLKEDGNVGIGTTFPSNKLEVNGTARAKEVIVEATGWPDFVFYPDYNLPSLEEVEDYITENKHLPEVPSESEVLEHGIKLGEMDATLLQKIEELTLYMIEQNKINKQQEELIKKQTKMIEELRKEVSILQNN